MALFAWFNMTMHAAGLQIASLLLPIVPPSLMSVLSLSPPLRLVLCCFSFRDVFRSPREAGQGHKQEQSPPAAAGLLAAHTTPTTHSTNTTTTKDAYVDNTLEDRHTHGRNTRPSTMVAIIRRTSVKSAAGSATASPKAKQPAAARSQHCSPVQLARKLSGGAAASKASAQGKKKKTVLHSDKPLRRPHVAAQSAPASPQQQPTSAIPPTQLPIHGMNSAAAAEPQQFLQAPSASAQQQVSASASPAPSTVSMDESVASNESEPVFSASEQQMLRTLDGVRTSLDKIEWGLPILRGQIQSHLARIAFFRMANRRGHSYNSPTLNANKLWLSHKSLRYNAALVDEQTMHAIFRLDSLQTDNEHIRRQRKQTVARAKDIIAQSVELVKRMDKIANLLPPKEPEPVEEQQPQPQEEQKQQTAKMTDVTDQEEHKEASQQTKEVDEEMRPVSPLPPRAAFAPGRQQPPTAATARKQSPPPATAAPSASAAPAASTANPLLRKYASMHLPTWRGPAFHSSVHPSTGALLIEADLSGVSAEDLQVSSDPATRVLTIRGVKLPQRRRSVPAYADFFGFGRPAYGAVEPHGYFEKLVDFKELDPTAALNLDAMTARLNADETLQIIVPRYPRKQAVQQQQQARPQTARAAPQPRPQQRRRPPVVQHTSGWAPSDDEDEGEAVEYVQQPRYAPQRAASYAPHPFYASRPQTAPRRPVQQHASPFFGGFW
jgi:hypothetical protein